MANNAPLIDNFGRTISYLRISVTDRCDFRCRYCMAEDMTFLPRPEVLSFEEIDRLAAAFVERGVTKIRLTGGEPLVRRDIAGLVERLSRQFAHGLQELTLTTNGNQLAKHATALKAAGVERINVSLDTLNPKSFADITRRGNVARVLDGIAAAKDAGLSVKINCVAMKGVNEQEIPDLMRWAHGEGHDLTLIETMPMGDTGEDRADRYLPLSAVREALETEFTLVPAAYRTGGPARYFDVTETGGRLGLITPLTQNFCAGCNRVRLTAKGELFMCLGQSDMVDFRAILRSGMEEPALTEALDAALDKAMGKKPEGHEFAIARERGQTRAAVPRHMSVTGG